MSYGLGGRPRFTFEGLADMSHGFGFRMLAAASESRVNGLAEQNQGFRLRALAAKQRFRIKGLAGQN